MDDHLGACAACRGAVREAVGHANPALARMLVLSEDEALLAAACPEERLLRRWAEGRADATDKEIAGIVSNKPAPPLAAAARRWRS